MIFKRLISSFIIFSVALSVPVFSEDAEPAAERQFAPRKKPLQEEKAEQPAARTVINENEAVIADFEEGLKNNLGGESGSWNIDEENPGSVINIEVVEKEEPNQNNHALRIDYKLDAPESVQNGFWTKLRSFDSEKYDHLQFDIRGDKEKPFTDVLKIELKKFKDNERVEKIKGTSIVKGVTSEWQTIRIPLNQMTGLLNFYDPEVWKNPSLGRKELDEFVVVLESRRVSQKAGTLYLDNVKFVKLGKILPTAVDFPPRKGEKTPVRLEGVDFMKFLVKRLNGFPERSRIRKKFPKSDERFLMQIARDTWRFFDDIVDKEHQLPLDTIQLGAKKPIDTDAFVGDYTNVTNIGLYLMCIVSAYDFGFISRAEAVKRLNATLDTIDKLEHHSSNFLYNYYDTTTIERTSYFVSLVDSGWLDTGLYVAKQAFPEELKERIEKILATHDYAFFYDPVEEHMFHGFYDNLNVYSDYHYGSFYTEPRAISYMAIARGDVPKDHWFRMFRTFPESYSWQSQMPKQREITKNVLGINFYGGFYEWNNIPYVPSWGGSGFEALMPAMILNERELAPNGLGLNDRHHVQITIEYTLNNLAMPVWGMSPSSKPEGGYSEYGVKVLGSRGYPAGVVTPHASVLALEFAPAAVVKNLRELVRRYDIYGPYGFYDAVTPETGLVARKYLALDQGMILIALNNFLNQGAIRKRFHSDPDMKSGEVLLTEEKFFEILKPERAVSTKPAEPIPAKEDAAVTS